MRNSYLENDTAIFSRCAVQFCEFSKVQVFYVFRGSIPIARVLQNSVAVGLAVCLSHSMCLYGPLANCNVTVATTGQHQPLVI